jgi:hypothetical protein
MQPGYLKKIKFEQMIIKSLLPVLFISCNSFDNKSSNNLTIDSSNFKSDTIIADGSKDVSDKIDNNISSVDSIAIKKKILSLMQGLWKQTESGEVIQISGNLFINKYSTGKKDSLEFFLSSNIKSGGQELKIPASEKNGYFIYFHDNDQYNYYYLLSVDKVEMHIMYSNGQTIGYRHITK